MAERGPDGEFPESERGEANEEIDLVTARTHVAPMECTVARAVSPDLEATCAPPLDGGPHEPSLGFTYTEESGTHGAEQSAGAKTKLVAPGLSARSDTVAGSGLSLEDPAESPGSEAPVEIRALSPSGKGRDAARLESMLGRIGVPVVPDEPTASISVEVPRRGPSLRWILLLALAFITGLTSVLILLRLR